MFPSLVTLTIELTQISSINYWNLWKMSKKEMFLKKAAVDMNFILSGIQFPSDPRELYRVITKMTETVR